MFTFPPQDGSQALLLPYMYSIYVRALLQTDDCNLIPLRLEITDNLPKCSVSAWTLKTWLIWLWLLMQTTVGSYCLVQQIIILNVIGEKKKLK